MEQKVNYDKMMKEQIAEMGERKTLLLHSCCAPCSTACLERLKDYFHITVLYYNPNIDDKAEYEKRKAEQIRFLEQTGWADFLDCDYDEESFEKIAKGLEKEPERGRRCYACYALRLHKTAEVAAKNSFNYFATTLTLSPYKKADWLNEIGAKEGGRYAVKYLFTDFKKGGGYYRSTQLSKAFDLYRQDFCGCRFSKMEREGQK